MRTQSFFLGSRKVISTRSKMAYLGPLVIVAFGLVFALVGIKGAQSARHLQAVGVVVKGEVFDVEIRQERNSEGHYRTVHLSHLRYTTTQGETYKTTLKKRLQVGDFVELIYDPSKPDSARAAEGQMVIPVIFAVVGILVLILGATLAVRLYIRQSQINWLLQHGHPVRAQVSAIEDKVRHSQNRIGSRNRGVRYSRRYHTHKLVCRPLETLPGGLPEYVSEELDDRPNDSVIGQEITVLVDPSNPKVYFVDVNKEARLVSSLGSMPA